MMVVMPLNQHGRTEMGRKGRGRPEGGPGVRAALSVGLTSSATGVRSGQALSVSDPGAARRAARQLGIPTAAGQWIEGFTHDGLAGGGVFEFDG